VSDSGELSFGFRDLLGFTTERGEGTGAATLDCDDRHLNPHGTVHGAVMFALIDTAMGAAAVSVLDEGSMCATIECQTRFLSPCFGGRLSATARVRKAGRRVIFLDGEVVDADGREIVTATASFAVIPRPA
jgi:acyl-CoA thioesterase